MRFQGIVYRAHDPKWAFSPISGEGARATGGRFNPKGMAALYTATSIESLFKEASQGFARKFDPLTICAYEVDCEDIVDLTSAAEAERYGIASSDLGCAWRLLTSRNEPVPSWLAANKLIACGVAGVLTPSFAPGATRLDINLVFWDWGNALPHKITVHDPGGKLPKDQSAW